VGRASNRGRDAAEHLASEDGILIHHETLRRWMRAAGLWSRRRQRSPYRQRRERKAHFGELVQLDGRQHPWLETRGPSGCAMTLVDDATGRLLLQFAPQETIWAAADVLRAWIEQSGVPHALYTDWKNVYVRRPTEDERLAGIAPLTHFGRMCARLGIRIIPASSPQAKGRIERQHGTQQDRWTKKLRRAGVSTYEAANAFVAAGYLVDHNTRFGRPAADPDVCEARDGRLTMRYRERVVAWREIIAAPPVARPTPPPPVAAPTPRLVRQKHRPSLDHPWRRHDERDIPLWQALDR
jgi:hypothetical protein